MSNLYSYIGSFEVSSGVIDIADPYINSMSIAIERIPFANEIAVKVRGVLSGIYECYHVIDDATDEIKGLMVFHRAYDINNIIKDKNIKNLGYVSSGLSNAVVLVDEAFRFDTRYCYNPIEMDAYYDGKLILQELPNMPYEDSIKEKIKEVVNKIIIQNEDIHPKGEDIMSVLNDLPVWNGFREFNLFSSHWSVDIINRLSNSFTNGLCIKAGVITTSPGGYLSCYGYRNHRGDIYAIVITLNTVYSEVTNISDTSKMGVLDIFYNTLHNQNIKE